MLRTHMRMNGSWHMYRPGEKWQLPARAMRILSDTADWVAVAFNVLVAEFVARPRSRRSTGRSPRLGRISARRLRSRRGAGRLGATRAPPDPRGAARPARGGRDRQRLQVGDAVPLGIHPDTPPRDHRDARAPAHDAGQSLPARQRRRWRRRHRDLSGAAPDHGPGAIPRISCGSTAAAVSHAGRCGTTIASPQGRDAMRASPTGAQLPAIARRGISMN